MTVCPVKKILNHLPGETVVGVLGQTPDRQIVGSMPGHVRFFAAANLMPQEFADEPGSAGFGFAKLGQRIVFFQIP